MIRLSKNQIGVTNILTNIHYSTWEKALNNAEGVFKTDHIAGELLWAMKMKLNVPAPD